MKPNEYPQSYTSLFPNSVFVEKNHYFYSRSVLAYFHSTGSVESADFSIKCARMRDAKTQTLVEGLLRVTQQPGTASGPVASTRAWQASLMRAGLMLRQFWWRWSFSALGVSRVPADDMHGDVFYSWCVSHGEAEMQI